MRKTRTFCADSPCGKQNCPYAKVVDERGYFHVRKTTKVFGEKGEVHTTEEKTETRRNAVYCIRSGNKFVGTVDTDGGVCNIPSDCPEIKKGREMIERIKSKLKW